MQMTPSVSASPVISRERNMKRWWNDLCDAWYYLRRTIRIARGKRILPITNGEANG